MARPKLKAPLPYCKPKDVMKTEGLSESEINAKHAEKMRRKKDARDKIIATKKIGRAHV